MPVKGDFVSRSNWKADDVVSESDTAEAKPGPLGANWMQDEDANVDKPDGEDKDDEDDEDSVKDGDSNDDADDADEDEDDEDDEDDEGIGTILSNVSFVCKYSI